MFRLQGEVVLLPRIEDIDLHRKLPPGDIEEGPDDVFPHIGGGEAKGGRNFDEAFLTAALADRESGHPQLFLCEQAVGLVEPLVLEPEQSAVFEVGRGHPPAPFEVAVEEVLEHPPQGVLRALPRRAADFRVRREVVEAGVHGIKDGAGEVAVTESGRQGALARPVQCRAQQGDLCKVVEVHRR